MSWFIGLATLVGVGLTACGGTFVANSGDAGSGGAETGGVGTGGTSSTGGELGSGAAPSGGGTPGSGGGTVSSGGKLGSGGKAGSGGKTGAGGGRTVEPTNHRPEHVACGTRPPPVPGGPTGDAGTSFQNCMTDAECTSGPNGLCAFGRIAPHCVYDACFNDGECGAGAVCACGSSQSVSRCLGEGCQIDADCPGSFCSPTFSTCGTYSGVVSYACHTPSDECTNDSDCRTGTPSASYCMYDPTVAHWICSSSQCAG